MTKREIHIFGGGTFQHVRSHLALAAPAFGTVAKTIARKCETRYPQMRADLHLTRMADSQSNLVTNDDVAEELKAVADNPLTKIIFFSAAICDFSGEIDGVTSEKDAARLQSRTDILPHIDLTPTEKLIRLVRTPVAAGGYGRKDILLVAFKTTCGSTPEEMYLAGLGMLKENSANLVLANDVKTRRNMIITPEEAVYEDGYDREKTLDALLEIAFLRSQLTFTQSTVVEGSVVPWSDERVPQNLREVVNYAVRQNAYKPFKGATVGHFATKLSDTEFLTSIRKSDFNKLDSTGLVYVKSDGPDTVLAYGAKPSVGGQSQRSVFRDHPGYDCILHFHCPLREDALHCIPTVSQREVECGSHECGKNTSQNLVTFRFGEHVIKAVMLDNHGPNIVFNKNTPAAVIIEFIESNFDLRKKTGGYQL